MNNIIILLLFLVPIIVIGIIIICVSISKSSKQIKHQLNNNKKPEEIDEQNYDKDTFEQVENNSNLEDASANLNTNNQNQKVEDVEKQNTSSTSLPHIDSNDVEALVALGKEKFAGYKEPVKNKDLKLEVKNLQVSFRTQAGILKAVRGISFDLQKGETFAIVGESGSGKSVTSKSIIGILSGNSIVEGGEILYDGQDLLKISEDDYHKIRGDKIAMIFQDPMSSLNPIMRVGQQLTEAMILKAKASRRNARKAFNSILKLLEQNIHDANGGSNQYNPANTTNMIKSFDSFCIENTKIEGVYNECVASAVELEFLCDNTIFLVSRHQKVDIKKSLKQAEKLLLQCIHPFVVVSDQQTSNYIERIRQSISQYNEENASQYLSLLQELSKLAKEASAKEKPNFFTLAYYKMMNPNSQIETMPIKELNEMTLSYLDNNFMLNFIKLSESGVVNSHNQSIALKKELLPYAYEMLGYLYSDDIKMSQLKKYVKMVSSLVSRSIDRLQIKKNSTEYVFKSAIKTAIKRYSDGIKTNPKELKKYNKNKAKYEKLIARGKTLDWTLKPLVSVDLDLTMNNIRKVVEDLIASVNNDIQLHPQFDANKHVIEIIDFLKEQASRVVVKMNKMIAKSKAIKLLEEVGIPEPTIRFNQYPFQFSGGMRQRIVIAIALSANPDILICDEPTTALDVTIQSQILELINVIKKERNLSVIFITHNLGVVANMADRIGVMYAGKIVEYGKSDEIFYDPRHPYTWALLSSMPDLHTKDKLDSIPGTPPNMIFPPVGDAFAPRNKYALQIDFEMQPPLFKVSDTHYAATWLLHPDAPKVEIPKIIKDRVERLEKEREKDGQ